MAANTFVCLSVLLNLATSLRCPAYTCDSSLNVSECARITSGNNIILNENGCEKGSYCSGVIIKLHGDSLAYANRTEPELCFPLNGTYFRFYNSTSYATTSPLFCGTADPSKKFKSGRRSYRVLPIQTVNWLMGHIHHVGAFSKPTTLEPASCLR